MKADLTIVREQIAGDDGFLDGEQGISSIALMGNRLSVKGWYDQHAKWGCVVDLTDEQRRALHEATR